MKGGKDYKAMMNMMMKMMQGGNGAKSSGIKNKVKGKFEGEKNRENKWEKPPPGAGRVFVGGFDFGTTDEQLEKHLKKAGQIVKVRWVTKGSAEVSYQTKQQAKKAADKLNNTTIPGNSRFIDVLFKENE